MRKEREELEKTVSGARGKLAELKGGEGKGREEGKRGRSREVRKGVMGTGHREGNWVTTKGNV